MVNLWSVVVRGLRVRRGGRPVLHGIDCTVPRGVVTGLLGPSGCGKTTLMRSIVGVQRIDGGVVTVLGHRAGSAGLRSRIGYATQKTALYPDLTVTENLRYFASVLRAPRDAVLRAIDQVDMREQSRMLASRLSGGQLSRANLAVSLLGSPEVLVLDEPTVGLDPVLRNELWALFRSLANDGVTLIVSSHVMDEAERCDRLMLMRDGNILAEDTPEVLRSRTGTTDLEHAFLRLVRDEETVPR